MDTVELAFDLHPHATRVKAKLAVRRTGEGPLVLEELREYARVLRKTEQRGLRWHLAVSWR